MLLGELRKSKVLKEVKLVDGLFKYKQSWVYVPQGKWRLSVFKEEYNSPNFSHRGERKNRHRMVSRRDNWRCIKEDITHFVKAWMKCQVNQASYQKQGGSCNRCLSWRGHGIVCAWILSQVCRSHMGMMPSC